MAKDSGGNTLKVGDKVTCSAKKTFDGKSTLCSWVRSSTFYVLQSGSPSKGEHYVVIGPQKGNLNKITAGVKDNTLTLVKKPTPAKKPTPKEDKKVTTPAKKPKDPPTDTSTYVSKNNIKIDKVTGDGSSGVITATSSTSKYVAYENEEDSSLIDLIDPNKTKVKFSKEKWEIFQQHPTLVQQNKNYDDKDVTTNKYPKVDKKPEKTISIINGKKTEVRSDYYKYDYETRYSKETWDNGLGISGEKSKITTYRDNILKSINQDITSRKKIQNYYTEYYNKYKIEHCNDRLSKTFAHVFFVRPDCNIYSSECSDPGGNPILVKNLERLSEFVYAKRHCPNVLRQLTQSGAKFSHQFMFLPSNKARSFELSDEYVTSDTYGKTLTGYKIAYGKHNLESKTAGKFSINYIDNRNLHVYHLHKLWTDYIDHVYRGKISPKVNYILNKNLDYATCVYYILCAEDGETILFWSKYWGVFPLEAPSSSLSYTNDNLGGVKDPELKIEYQYSWKEDFNPLSLIEFNTHCKKKEFNYIKSYNSNLLSTGYTWTGAPFIESIPDNKGSSPYIFKLRFSPM